MARDNPARPGAAEAGESARSTGRATVAGEFAYAELVRWLQRLESDVGKMSADLATLMREREEEHALNKAMAGKRRDRSARMMRLGAYLTAVCAVLGFLFQALHALGAL